MRKRFNSSEEEEVLSLIKVFSNMLGIDKHVIWIRDRKTFNRSISRKKINRKDAAHTSISFSFIWLDEKYHLVNPKIQLYSTIIHELLHIKYPKYTEHQIKKLEVKLSGIEK